MKTCIPNRQVWRACDEAFLGDPANLGKMRTKIRQEYRKNINETDPAV